MPARDRTGPRGEYVNCVDPKNGARRPLRFNRPRLGLGRRSRRGRR